VRVIWASEAVEGFHARYSAIARYYRYRILNRNMKSALQPQQMTWFYYPLDVEKMQAAADHLIGEHDFSSFRAQGCQSKSPVRFMHYMKVGRIGDEVYIDIIANAFVHHMVRNIAGVLMAIGSDQKPVEWTKELLQIKDRKQGGMTAAPDGLYLAGIYYPNEFNIPTHPLFQELPEGVKRFNYNDKNKS
jgi:tRNA pseudouridine38-40 synthase